MSPRSHRHRAEDRRGSSPRYVLRLYVTGLTSRSTQAVQRTRNLCEQHLAGRYELQVIDLYQQPALARREDIVAAPTLIKVRPLPRRTMVGNLADEERVLRGLSLRV